MSEPVSVEMDEETAKLFIIFQRHRDSFTALVESGVFTSPLSNWLLSMNAEGKITTIVQKDRVAFRA